MLDFPIGVAEKKSLKFMIKPILTYGMPLLLEFFKNIYLILDAFIDKIIRNNLDLYHAISDFY